MATAGTSETAVNGSRDEEATASFGRDQLKAFMLAASFVINRGGNCWIDFVQRARHGRSFHRRASMQDRMCVLILTRAVILRPP